MNGRVAKHWRRKFRRRWKFDADAFIDDVIDLSFKWRLGLCYRVLFKRKTHPKKAEWWIKVKKRVRGWL